MGGNIKKKLFHLAVDLHLIISDERKVDHAHVTNNAAKNNQKFAHVTKNAKKQSNIEHVTTMQQYFVLITDKEYRREKTCCPGLYHNTWL